MKRNPSRALAIAAGLVIVALTAAAFWLSYAHLAEVALAHGMRDKEVRAWAWPATLDLFIVAGELLMLRAALASRVDWWAIGLTVVGSGGSIVLNVAGVGSHAELLDYVVAAVPPTAALLAFGALMRQIHQALAEHTQSTLPPELEEVAAAPEVTATVTVERVPEPSRIQFPARALDPFTTKSYKELPPPAAEPEAEPESGPEPEPSAIDLLARQHKVGAEQIRTVAELLAVTPELSGKAAGEAIERGDRYGRRVLLAARELRGVRS